MALKEIIENENQRIGNGVLTSIFLYQEGMFYRAYEWSAWLCVRYISQFKVTRLGSKDGSDGPVFVGLPVSSLAKFIPEEFEIRESGEKCIIVELPDTVFGDNAAPEQLKDDFDNWKGAVPHQPKKASLKQDMKAEQPQRLTDIMARVLAFPLEQKSPMDCMSFIATLKQQISEIL